MALQSTLFVDPMQLKPVRLGPGTLQWLVNAKQLKVAVNSPIEPLLKVPQQASDQNNRELVSLGISLDPADGMRPSPKGKAYAESLRIAAQPEALLEFSELGPVPKTIRMLLGGGKATIADIDVQGLSFSPPITDVDLVRGFSRHLQNTSAQVATQTLWPSQLRLIGWIFTGPEKTIPQAVAAERLVATGGIVAVDAKEIVAELIGAKLLKAEGDSVGPTPPTAQLLARMASGHLAELVLTPYDEAGTAGEKTELRFVGRPDDRLTTVTLRGELLAAFAGKTPSEDRAIQVIAAEQPTLVELLRSLLGE